MKKIAILGLFIFCSGCNQSNGSTPFEKEFFKGCEKNASNAACSCILHELKANYTQVQLEDEIAVNKALFNEVMEFTVHTGLNKCRPS